MKLPRLRVCLYALPLLSATTLNAQTVASLLRPAEAGTRSARSAPPGRGLRVHRSRLVEVNQDALMTPVAGPRRVSLELFSGTEFLVDEQRSYWSADGSTFLWVGKIDGMSRGHVVLAATGDIVSANVTTDNNDFYWIRQADGRVHTVQQVEPQDNLLHDEVVLPGSDAASEPAVAVDDSRQRSPERLATVSRDAGTTIIDLMVCYTTKAKNAAGGDAGIQNKIQLSVAETNQGYVNSQINIQLNLVHTMEVTYDETANSIDQALSDLRGSSDGKMDEIHAVRNTYGADLVTLFIDKVGSSGGTVGIGYLMQTVSTSFAGYGFSVNEQYWSTGPGWTLAHELGHNMGCAHDRNNSADAGAYPYSYGYQRTTSPTFRTIMAYACSGVNCPRILYFSNPSVNYSSVPTGIANGQANSADNGTTLNNTAATVAAFRATASGCTYNVSPTSASAAASGGSGSVTVSAGSGCAWTAQTSSGFLSITSGSSGSGNGTVNYSVSANSGAARSDTLIVAGQTVTVNQSAASCSYTLNPGSASFGSSGGTTSVGVTAGSGCGWTASTATGWITLNSGTSGTGNGSVNYTVQSNSGAARNGSITVAGQTFAVSQSAGVSSVSINFASNPSGLSITVDGVSYVTPISFNWQVGSSHSLDALQQGSGSTRYAFQSWSQGGASAQSITTPSSTANYTASFNTQYLLTATSTPPGSGGLTFTPAYTDGFYNSGTSVQVTANPNSGYQFGSWSGAASGSTSSVQVAMTAPKSVVANFTSAAVAVTVDSSPSGLSLTVDGVSYATPHAFNWQPGSTHSLAAAMQGSGTRYSFLSWSQGGGATQTITTPSSQITYSASFKTQYLLTTSATPAGNGSLGITPSSVDGYYDSGTGVQLTATPASGYQFAGWTGSASGNTNPLPLTMNTAKTVTATFSPASNNVTINSSPSGLTIVADGVQYVAPKSFQWATGSSHTIGVVSPQQAAGTRYTFSGWSDSGGAGHSITVPAGSATYTASFTTSYQLTTSVAPVAAGSITANPSTADGYYAAGTAVQLTANPASGYAFGNWSGDAGGAPPSTSVTMNAPRAVAANFTTVSTCAFVLSPLSASVLASGDIREVSVSTTSGCAWTAVPQVSWITILSGSSGSGNGVVRFTVAANAGASRTGAINIGGVLHTITQSGANCSYTLSAPGGSLSASGDQIQVTVATQAGCTWTAATTKPWLTLPGTTNGIGSGAVNVTLPANTGAAARSGAVVVGGQWIHVMQRGTSNAGIFNDVPSTYSFFDFINLLGLNSISPGCGGGAYCPEVTMTRAEMAAFIIRSLYGESFAYSPTPYFTDAPVSHSHFKYIQKMKELGITVGCTLTAYCPNDAVTRGQMAVFLVRATLGINNLESFPYPQTPYFDDIPSNHTFFPFIQKMKELGITAGCSATGYCSDLPNTRGQMAVFITRSFF